MGFLDDLVGDALGNVFTGGRSDKQLQRLHDEGELVPATIYAIRIVSKGEDADEHSYGLDLATSAGPVRASVRQQLIPDPWRAPLGARVLARHLAGAVAIDWPATLDEAGVAHEASFIAIKTLKTPLQPGIDDARIDHRRLRDGISADAQIVSSEPVEVLGMPTQNRRLELRVDDDAGPRTVAAQARARTALRRGARRRGRAGAGGDRSQAAGPRDDRLAPRRRGRRVRLNSCRRVLRDAHDLSVACRHAVVGHVHVTACGHGQARRLRQQSRGELGLRSVCGDTDQLARRGRTREACA